MSDEEKAHEALLDQLLENEVLTKTILMFLDLKTVHELTVIPVDELMRPPYKMVAEDKSFGELPDALKKLHQLIYSKVAKKAALEEKVYQEGGSIEEFNRLKNEVALLPALFENLVHGACEVPWDTNFTVTSCWQVVEDND